MMCSIVLILSPSLSLPPSLSWMALARTRERYYLPLNPVLVSSSSLCCSLNAQRELGVLYYHTTNIWFGRVSFGVEVT